MISLEIDPALDNGRRVLAGVTDQALQIGLAWGTGPAPVIVPASLTDLVAADPAIVPVSVIGPESVIGLASAIGRVWVIVLVSAIVPDSGRFRSRTIGNGNRTE